MDNFDKYQADNSAEPKPENPEESPFDPLTVGGMNDIQRKPSYAALRDEAVAAYLQDRRRARVYLLIGILLLLLSLFFCIDIGQHPLILIAAVCLFLSLWWLLDTLKKFSKAKRMYRYRLSRAVEILSNVNVFMEIPKEDLERFDRFWQ